MLGAVAGVFIETLLVAAGLTDDSVAELPWYSHLSVGNLAFGIVFLATDPTTSPQTAAGRWAYGMLIGLLAIVIRVIDPAHPEGSLSAILLASLGIPLIDHAMVRLGIKRLPDQIRQI